MSTPATSLHLYSAWCLSQSLKDPPIGRWLVAPMLKELPEPPLRLRAARRPRRIGVAGEGAGPWTGSAIRREADADGLGAHGRHVAAPPQWGRGQ
jgi:hypothetical protein